jgi:hypothetical protein
MNEYMKSQWLFEVANIISKREFIEKKAALWIIIEDIEEFDEMYNEGLTPQAAYKEMQE